MGCLYVLILFFVAFNIANKHINVKKYKLWNKELYNMNGNHTI